MIGGSSWDHETRESAQAVADERNAENLNNILDCGHHYPQNNEPRQYTGGASAGKWYVSSMGGAATTPDGRRICRTCAEGEELAAFAADDVTRWSGAYLSDDGRTLTTWTGCKLANVVEAWDSRISPSVEGIRFRAVDEHGRRWYGTTPGRGMYAHMHRNKAGQAA